MLSILDRVAARKKINKFLKSEIYGLELYKINISI